MHSRSTRNGKSYVESAFAVFLDTVVKDMDLLYVGSDGESIDRLAVSARSVTVVTTDPPPARPADDVFYARPDSKRLPLDDDTVDVALVPEVALLGDDLPEALDQLRRVVRQKGRAVVGTVNPDSFVISREGTSGGADSIGYERLHRALSARFKFVRMFGQAPFAGYVFFDFAAADGLEEIGFDGTLAEQDADSPNRFLALCADEEVSLEPYLVVRIPAANAFPAGDEASAGHARAEGTESRQESDDILRLETALRDCGGKVGDLRRELERREALVRDLVERLRGSDHFADPAVPRTAGSSTDDPSADDASRDDAEVRTLRSSFAELTEARDAAEARLVLVEHDLSDAHERTRAAERTLQEMREQFELELARSRIPGAGEREGRLDEENAALRGESEGLRARARDVERSLQELLEENASLSRSVVTGRDEIESLQSLVSELKLKESVLKTRLSDAEKLDERDRRKRFEATLKRTNQDERVSSLETELSASQDESRSLREAMEALTIEHDRTVRGLETALSSEGSRAAAAENRISELEETLAEARDSLRVLAGSVEPLAAGTVSAAEYTVSGEGGEEADPAALESLRSQLVQRDERIRSLEIRLREIDAFRDERPELEAELKRRRKETDRIAEDLREQLDIREAMRARLRALGTSVPAGSDGERLVAELLGILDGE
jgi:SAM-dependent methyltransferase